MKDSFYLFLLFAVLLFSACLYPKKSQGNKVLIGDLERLHAKNHLKGSILIFDFKNDKYYSNDFSWAKKGNLPASTFKIPNSIIALETGLIVSDSTVLKWDGEKRSMQIWEKDLSFKEAFQLSCVPCFQELARKTGTKRMKNYLEKFGYPGMVFDSSSIDKFWLEGKSRISQFEQIEFIKKFYFSELPVSKKTENIVKNIMLVEKTENYRFSGKTGWGVRDGRNNGWYVGFLEKKENVYFFATNVIPDKNLPINDFLFSRISATKDALRFLKLME